METISIVVIVVLALIFVALTGLRLYGSIKLKGLRQTAIDLIVKAEGAFEQGMNDEKFSFVVDSITAFLPSVAKVFINESTIKMFVQAVFDSIKSALDVQPKISEEIKSDIEEKNNEEAKG